MQAETTSGKRRGAAAAVVLAIVAAVALAVRELSARRVPAPEGSTAGWIVTDPDGLYHARRIARALDDGLVVAGTDPLLNHPHGAAIPWPPVYDTLLAWTLAPFAPREAGRRRDFVEHAAGTLPSWFGVLTSVVVAATAWLLGERRASAALAAGLAHATCTAATIYAKPGIADHHAFAALVIAALALVVSAYCTRASGGRATTRPWLHGTVAGALAGVLLGSWVAGLVHVALVQATMFVCAFGPLRRRAGDVCRFQVAFHGMALLVLAPAVAASPWRTSTPWIVVNLSWFHVVWLAAGGAVFALALGGKRTTRALGIATAAALAVAGLLMALDAPPWRGVREALAWASRADEFMASIEESQPLLGPRGAGWGQLFGMLGHGIVLLPLAWLVALGQAFVRRRAGFAIWAIATPVLTVQALRQMRFSDVLAIAACVLGGSLVAALIARLVDERRGGARAALACLLAAGAGLALQPTSVAAIGRRIARHGFAAPEARAPRARAARATLAWLRARADERGDLAAGQGVLANWSQGHGIEWIAGLPTVATNFGSYIGEDSWRAPGHFFLAEDPVAAEEALRERDVRWIYITSDFPNALPILVRASFPEQRERWIAKDARGRASLTNAFFATMGARLMFGGLLSGGENDVRPLDFLRLVRISPERDLAPKLAAHEPACAMDWIWERVPGARLEFRGGPGAVLAVEIRVRFAAADEDLLWQDRNVAGEDGRAVLRVPWSTEPTNGDGIVTSARWTGDGTTHELRVPERAVVEGATLVLGP